jgi:hypothetical protein
MKNEDKKRQEEQTPVSNDQSKDQNRDRNEAPKEETMEERARREHWTDVAESHLGIDE